MPEHPPITLMARGRALTLEHDGLRFSNSDPGGYESIGFNPTTLDHLYPGNIVEVFCGLHRLGWYIINDPGEDQQAGRSTFAVEGIGPGEKLKRRQRRHIFIDRDLSRWGGMTTQRQYNVEVAAAHRVLGSGEVKHSETEYPAFVQHITPEIENTVGRSDIMEAWYDAEGIAIGSMYARIQTTQEGGAALAGSQWKAEMFLSTDDVHGSYDSYALPAGSLDTATENTLTGTVARYWANLRWYYGTSAAATKGSWTARWQRLAVYGRHGLTKRGPNPGGFYGGDIVRYVCRLAGVKMGPVSDSSGYIIPHLTYRQQVDDEQVVDDISKLLGGWHYGMWADSISTPEPEMWFTLPPAAATASVSKRACQNMKVPRVRLDQLYNEAQVSYSDGTGNTLYVTVNVPNPLLGQTEIPTRTMAVEAGICNIDQARTIGKITLLLQQRIARGSGSATLPPFVDTPQGPMPSCMLKAGRDRVQISDLPDPGPLTEGDTRRFDTFHVRRVETVVDAAGQAVTTIDFDGGSDLMETFRRRADLQMTAAGIQ